MLEKVLPPDPGFQHPICLRGAGACPPEDCGGIYGYSRLVYLAQDPEHPEYEETIDCLGESYGDPFSVDAVNLELKCLPA